MFDAEEKRKNIRIYRGSHDLTELEADFIEANGGNVDNEDLLKYFFNIGNHSSIPNYSDNVIISFDKKSNITNYSNSHIKDTSVFINIIKDDLYNISSIFDNDIQYPQWVLDIPVNKEDRILQNLKRTNFASGSYYTTSHKLVRNNDREYLISCIIQKNTTKPPKEFHVYFTYKYVKQHVKFENKGSAINAEWSRYHFPNKSGTIRRTKTFESRIESAITLIEQWIKELETETKE